MKNTENDVSASACVDEKVSDNAALEQQQAMPHEAVRQHGPVAVNPGTDADVTPNEPESNPAAAVTSGGSGSQRYSFTASELLELVALAHERGYRSARDHSRRTDEDSDVAPATTDPAATPAADDKAVATDKHAAMPAGRPVFMAAPRVGFWD